MDSDWFCQYFGAAIMLYPPQLDGGVEGGVQLKVQESPQRQEGGGGGPRSAEAGPSVARSHPQPGQGPPAGRRRAREALRVALYLRITCEYDPMG
jgi:hypothetical protein